LSDGGREQRFSNKKGGVYLTGLLIVSIVIEERAYHRCTTGTGLAKERVKIGEEVISQFNGLAISALIGFSKDPWLLIRRCELIVVATEGQEGS
jgi:hypothetical protein